MNPQIMKYAAMASMAVSIIAAGIAAHAPESIPGLWVVQAARDIFGAGGLAALFLQPPIGKPSA
jgi:hypothetical protein